MRPRNYQPPFTFQGPRAWVLAVVAGLLLGLVLARLWPAQWREPEGPAQADASRPTIVEFTPAGEARVIAGAVATTPLAPTPTGFATPIPGEVPPKPTPVITATLCIPFAALLGCIAVLPLVVPGVWHGHYGDIALGLGALVVGYYLGALGGASAYGRERLLHSAVDYYQFIALVGGLYVVSGGILVDVRGRGTPLANTLLLGAGALLANVVGTTGASVLFIRPFMRINEGRLRPLHVVFFIFIVSNCGGCLTPVGDPPLYLGFLSGVPFSWTLTHLWPMWAVVNLSLLGVFFILDTRLAPANGAEVGREGRGALRVRLGGVTGVVCMVLMIGAVFIDPVLRALNAGVEEIPIGASLQIAIAAAAYMGAPHRIHAANAFTFEPALEVALLFAGIFATMTPALALLKERAPGLGLESPAQYYVITGVLSSVLDNAPTYLSFLHVAFGVLGLDVGPEAFARFLADSYDIVHTNGVVTTISGRVMLEAISLGSVFFGAMTYIGNGPNFMVRSIATAHGVRMPSFIGYIGYAAVFLLPVLALNWALFLRG